MRIISRARGGREPPNLCECGCGVPVMKRFVSGHHVRTDECRRKNREAHIGKPAWNKGKTGIYSDETLQKIRDARKKQIMKPGRKHSAEANEKNRLAHLGKKQSPETNKKRSVAMLGKLKSDAHRQNISMSKKDHRNPAWKGGISRLPYGQDWTDDLRDAIRKRDEYACRICGVHQDGFAHDVHHIDYDKENNDPQNLVTLCRSCHTKTGYKRRRWEKHFFDLQSWNGLQLNKNQIQMQ